MGRTLVTYNAIRSSIACEVELPVVPNSDQQWKRDDGAISQLYQARNAFVPSSRPYSKLDSSFFF